MQSQPPQRPHDDQLDGIKALIVDDHDDIAAAFALVLSNHGATPHRVSSTRDAVQALSWFRPDVIVCELSLDDGLIVAAVMLGGRGLPRISVSADATDEARVRARKAGFAFHLVKPIEPEELVRIVALAVRVTGR
jgi:DNA-binding response OmpR family regulator